MATTTQTSANAQRLIKGDRLMFSSSDDNVMSKQIQATHASDDREVDVRPLLHLIEDIFKLLKIVQLSCKCSGSGGGDAHTITISILNMLKNYSWDAKLVLVLSACAVNFGEFWLLAHNCTTNQLAKSVAILRKIPELLERTSMLKPRFDTINNLVKVMVDITKCIVEFRELPPQYITTEVTALSTAMTHIPVAVYWTIRESWELSSLAHKVGNMQSHLATQLSTCYKHIDERKQMEAYQNLHRLMEMIHIDNLKVLKALIYQKDDLLPLFDGVTKRRVSIDVLRRKYVLLLISDVDISQEEVAILEQINNEARQHEVVWLPILDSNAPWTENRQKHFDSLQASMPWYCVQHPSLIEPAVVKYIKEVWNFRKKAILVVIDPQGRVSSLNALHMMWIWGGTAFPFTSAREEALWKEETWKLDLLVDSIDPLINKWVSTSSQLTVSFFSQKLNHYVPLFMYACTN
ncbi:protein sieve element occlusion b [Quercus suber]|uniref:Protein sieve element occlusion b n=1 Tax=Quercus suber TaxID=58331 RepID=A0AAW0M477_QUESU